MKKKKIDFIFTIAGPGTWLGIAILTAVALDAEHKKSEKEAENITIKEAPLLEIEKVETNIAEASYRLLKLDVNKNGIFDEEDVIVKDKNIPPLRVEKNNNIIYFENQKNNERGILAFQDNNNNYFLKEQGQSIAIRKKLDEYITENKQR